MRSHTFVPRCLCALVPFLILSCSTEPGHQPGADFGFPITTRDPDLLISLITYPAAPDNTRQQADTLLAQTQGSACDLRLNALADLLANPANPEPLRIYALDQLIAADCVCTADTLAQTLPTFDGLLLTRACAHAITLGKPTLTEPLIRSLARALPASPSTLESRPEWHAITTLTGSPIEDALFTSLQYGQKPASRIAALDLLQSLLPSREIIRTIHTLPPNDPNIADLQWWAALFNSLPMGPEETLWMQTRHQTIHAPLISAAAARHKSLQSESDYQFAPHFLATLAATDDRTAQLSRTQLIADLNSILKALSHNPRTPQYPGSPDDVDQSLVANFPKLTRADLLTIRLLLTSLQSSATLHEIHQLGQIDLADTTTEHGGLLKFDTSLQIIPYPPMFSANDLTYLTSAKLLQDTPLGLAQYHFHYQQLHNADRAGPGPGDLAYARNSRCNCIVFTSLDATRFNADYYTPAGAVVDLGIYSTR